MSFSDEIDEKLKTVENKHSKHELDIKDSVVDELLDKGNKVSNDSETSESNADDEKLSKERNLAQKELIRPFIPMYLLREDLRVNQILNSLSTAHDRFMKAKYNLYKKRAEFYTNKENWDNCKTATGKQSDGVFKEYFKSFDENRKLMEDREIAEFEYEQCKKIFESL